MAEVNKAELRKLAEAAPEDIDDDYLGVRRAAMRAPLTPSVVLSLLDESDAQAARIAELEREVEQFKEANRRLSEENVSRRNSGVEIKKAAADLMAANIGMWAESNDLKNTINQLRSELEACRKDAERYRWLRSQRFQFSASSKKGVASIRSSYCGFSNVDMSWVDSHIDAAMKEGGV